MIKCSWKLQNINTLAETATVRVLVIGGVGFVLYSNVKDVFLAIDERNP